MPQSQTPLHFHNLILSGLDAHDCNRVRPLLSKVSLTFRQRLETPTRPIDRVYFVETGLVSVVTSNRSGNKQAEVGLIGFEGMTGLAVVTGAVQSPNEAVMQSDGSAYSISAADLRSLIDRSQTLAKCFALYGFIFHVQTTSTVFVNAEGTIEQRLSRWLLMAQDRLKCPDLKLTHATLSVMLGARRPGVSIALKRLAGLGLISMARGSILVLNRRELIAYAQEFYGVPEAEYQRLFIHS